MMHELLHDAWGLMFWLHSRNPLPFSKACLVDFGSSSTVTMDIYALCHEAKWGGGNFFWKLIPDWRKGAGHGLESWWANLSLLERSDVWSLRRAGLQWFWQKFSRKNSCGWDVGTIKGLVESRKCTFCVLHGISWRLMLAFFFCCEGGTESKAFGPGEGKHTRKSLGIEAP